MRAAVGGFWYVQLCAVGDVPGNWGPFLLVSAGHRPYIACEPH